MTMKRCSKEMVYKEYNMTPQGIARDVLHIKNWLVKQPHLPIIQPELLSVDVDEWLENYLINCKNSVERAKECLDMYFTSKILLPEVFTNRDPTHPAFMINNSVMRMGILSGRTDEGRRVIVFSHAQPIPEEEWDPVVMMKRLTMMLDLLLQEGVDFKGLEAVVDSANIAFHHFTKYNLVLTKKLVDIGLKALPTRIHRVHVVNPNALVDTGISFFKPLVPKKIQQRITVVRDLKELQDTLRGCELPCDLGGSGPSLDELSQSWQDKLIEYRSWFESHDSVKSDESKRIGKCRYESQAFGAQGSFRKIEVD